jgi:nicotinamidase-related amidase
MKRTLLVVDLQNGFMNDFTRHIPGTITRLIERDAFDRLLFTRFVNKPDGPYPKMLGWSGVEQPPDTDIVSAMDRFLTEENVFAKDGTAGIPSSLRDLLSELAVETMTLVGVDTDMCVLKTAMDIFDMGIEPIIETDCCASTAGLQAHLAGLSVLARNIGANHLRHSGIGGPELGAPQ